MDIKQSIQTLEILAGGVDPVTGEVIPRGSPYNQPEVIRALYTCVQHYSNPPKTVKKTTEEKQAENISKGLPRNAGLAWSDQARASLAEDYGAGHTPVELAGRYERSRGSIIAELKRQGLISEEEARHL